MSSFGTSKGEFSGSPSVNWMAAISESAIYYILKAQYGVLK
jgi:hypothetical protein